MINDVQLVLDDTKYKPKVYQWSEVKDDLDLLIYGYLVVEFPRFMNDKSQKQFQKMQLYRSHIRKHGVEIVE